MCSFRSSWKDGVWEELCRAVPLWREAVLLEVEVALGEGDSTGSNSISPRQLCKWDQDTIHTVPVFLDTVCLHIN